MFARMIFEWNLDLRNHTCTHILEFNVLEDIEFQLSVSLIFIVNKRILKSKWQFQRYIHNISIHIKASYLSSILRNESNIFNEEYWFYNRLKIYVRSSWELQNVKKIRTNDVDTSDFLLLFFCFCIRFQMINLNYLINSNLDLISNHLSILDTKYIP